MKILFLSSSDISIETYEAVKKNHEIKAVITTPDVIKGRSKSLIQTPIAEKAFKDNIKVYKPGVYDKEFLDELKKMNCDLFITFSFGVILKSDFFNLTKYGGINIHPSLLPDLRGPSPIQYALLKGYKKTGLTIQKMSLKVDSGDILFQKEFEITEDDDEISLTVKSSKTASENILNVLEQIEKNTVKPIKQDDSKATYCKLIKKEQGLIDWNDRGLNIVNKIRAFVKWPIAYSFIDKMRINIYKAKVIENFNFNLYKDLTNGKIIFADKKNGIIAKTSDSLIKIESLQKEGKKILGCIDFINGFKGLENKIFSN